MSSAALIANLQKVHFENSALCMLAHNSIHTRCILLCPRTKDSVVFLAWLSTACTL